MVYLNTPLPEVSVRQRTHLDFFFGFAEQFQGQLKHVFRLWIDALAEVAREAGVPVDEAAERAEQAVLEIQGALILSAALETRQPFRRIIDSLPNKLLAPKASA